MNHFLETSELKAVTVYKFTCPTCKNSLTVSKPFKIHFCPFCAAPLDEDYAENSNKKRKSKKPVRSCKNCFTAICGITLAVIDVTIKIDFVRGRVI